MTLIFWQNVGYFLIIIGTIISGVASYRSNQEANKVISQLEIKDAELLEATRPEVIDKHVSDKKIERFKLALRNNSSLEGFFPQANLFTFSDDDYEEIVIPLVQNKSEDWNNSYGVNVVKLLYKKLHTRASLDRRLDAIIINSYHLNVWDFDQNIEEMLLSRSFENYKIKRNKTTSIKFLTIFILAKFNTIGSSQAYKYISEKYTDHASQNALQDVLNSDVKVSVAIYGEKVRWLEVKSSYINDALK